MPLCTHCRSCLSPNLSGCLQCAAPLPVGATKPGICGICIVNPPAFNRVVAPWLYDRHMAFLIGRWKYHRAAWLTPLLAQLWLVTRPEPVDIVVPVPLHWRRQWQRGYNQAGLLANQLHRQLRQLNMGFENTALYPRLLTRQQHTSAQAGLDTRQRQSNVQQAFRLAPGSRSKTVHGKSVALVDDILTTGATSDTLARLLLTAGARQVEVWSLARTPPPTFASPQGW